MQLLATVDSQVKEADDDINDIIDQLNSLRKDKEGAVAVGEAVTVDQISLILKKQLESLLWIDQKSVQDSQGGSLHSFGMYDDAKEPINLSTLKRLRTVALAIKSTQEILDKQKLLLDGNLSGLENAHNLSSEIKNLEILNDIKSKEVDYLKRMCTKKRIALLKLNDERKRQVFRICSQIYTYSSYSISNVQEESRIVLKACLSRMDVRYESIVPILDIRQKYLHIFTQLGRNRRRILLKELIEIFRIKV
uniref:Uncharacterized protein n=1 Tax=Heterorhabditis bacteriophora TaxID=37862 RepID=A0A1I7X668_HETBA